MTITRLYGGEADPGASVRAVLREGRACADPPACVALMRRRYRNRHAIAISDNYVRFAGASVDLIPTDETVIAYYNMMLFRRGHPLLEIVNQHVLLAMQSGLILHWERAVRLLKHVEDEDAADGDEDNHDLGLDSIGFVFGALLVGCASAALCFALECVVGRGRGARDGRLGRVGRDSIRPRPRAGWVGDPTATAVWQRPAYATGARRSLRTYVRPANQQIRPIRLL
ncbi:uncharacterized protein LOC127752330 [Frankliniella occidentalis]|uniref:Uncharacterized protein LOC127752330 n=1 Tax=Frankliniella occidentalis TaxID=133901 RepID=A0A9C6XWE4_FRAOC|nr:uncharacterized protein LOC127752330 [Frankliniella occidentalis]